MTTCGIGNGNLLAGYVFACGLLAPHDKHNLSLDCPPTWSWQSRSQSMSVLACALSDKGIGHIGRCQGERWACPWSLLRLVAGHFEQLHKGRVAFVTVTVRRLHLIGCCSTKRDRLDRGVFPGLPNKDGISTTWQNALALPFFYRSIPIEKSNR